MRLKSVRLDAHFLSYRIRVSKGLPCSAAWQMAQKNIVQVAFVRWRGDSKIVEANAEHDFRLKRLIGMLRTTKRAQIFCAICQVSPPDRPFDALRYHRRQLCNSSMPPLRKMGTVHEKRAAVPSMRSEGTGCTQKEKFIL